MPPHRSNPITDAQRETFLASLAEGHPVTVACRSARIGRSTAYEHRHRDEAFALAWHDAYEAGSDRFEAEARRRAIEGTLEPVFYRGEEVGHVRRFSNRLLELELKARRPDKYRERVDHTVTAAPLSPEQLQAAREAGLRPEVAAAAATLASVPLLPSETGSE